jgi:hypothetical protein
MLDAFDHHGRHQFIFSFTLHKYTVMALNLILPYNHAVNCIPLQKIWKAMGTLHWQEVGTIRCKLIILVISFVPNIRNPASTNEVYHHN